MADTDAGLLAPFEAVTAASTPKGERRRQALVEAAAELLAEGGFDAVRHRAVAERATLPLASTTYYFTSLDDLVAAAVEHSSAIELAEGRARLASWDGRDRDLDSVVELFLDLLLGPDSREGAQEDVLRRYEQLVASGRRPYLGPLMRRLRAELDALLAEILRRSGTEVDSEELFRLVALVDGAVLTALIESNPDPRGAARRILLSAMPASG